MNTAAGKNRIARYATRTDFCEIFQEQMGNLYWLSMLLMAEEGKAEECFLSAFEQCIEAKAIFEECALSWARRSVITNAIQLTGRHRKDSSCDVQVRRTAAVSRLHVAPAIESILILEVIQRFVFVMTVCERFSDQECAVLLSCSRQHVREVRLLALQKLGNAARTACCREVDGPI